MPLAEPADLQQIARFDDPSFLEDPYGAYARLRREAPVWWCESASAWTVTRYADARTVLLDPESFTSAPQGANAYLDLDGPNPYDDPGSGMLVLTEPPAHRTHRRMFTGGASYSSGAAEAMRARMARMSEELVAALPEGDVDAVDDVARPAVMWLMKEFFDLLEPQADEPPWQDALLGYYSPGTGAATTGLHRYMERLVRTRRQDHGHDPVSLAVQANDRKGALSDAQMAWNFFDAILAGGASTLALAAESINVIARNPRWQSPDYWDTTAAAMRSTEELLRWASHIHQVTRTATRDVELNGRLIRSGDTVFVVLASADRDESVWDRGDELDLAREPRQANFAFGHGPHVATGSMLARTFLSTLLPAFLHTCRPFSPGALPSHARIRGISTPVSVPITRSREGTAPQVGAPQ
ncbi:cytochrome P450 [Streptomyces sp. NPDC001663]|uniref:cytochrome P450 n=1 Tax=Streptomyces sp. NPDC001663 TaxID=3364597 RepID=UPI0036AF79F8